MKTHIQLSSLCVAALLLTACASTPSVPDAALPPERIASLMAINDNLIVPGERMGPVFLGMTEQQLYKKAGEPTSSETVPGTISYAYPSLVVSVDTTTHKVWEIDTRDFRYATAEGIACGSSSLAMRTKLLEKYSVRSIPGGVTYTDYVNGLSVLSTPSTAVKNLAVWRPGKFHY